MYQIHGFSFFGERQVPVGGISLEKSDRELVCVSELKLEFLKVDDDTDIYSKLPSMCSASKYLLTLGFFLVYLFNGESDFTGLTLKEKIHLDFKLELEYNSFLAFE